MDQLEAVYPSANVHHLLHCTNIIAELISFQDKKELAGQEALTNDTVAYAHCENFALKIFLAADNEDRAGKASKYDANILRYLVNEVERLL